MYLLDTNVVSEIRKIEAGRANPGVRSWVNRVEINLTYISVVTIKELEIGVLLAERRDPASGAILRRWLDADVHEAFEGRILPVNVEEARLAALLHVPDPAPFADALIAATAMASNLTVVTRNAGDFQRFGLLQTLNPWSQV